MTNFIFWPNFRVAKCLYQLADIGDKKKNYITWKSRINFNFFKVKIRKKNSKNTRNGFLKSFARGMNKIQKRIYFRTLHTSLKLSFATLMYTVTLFSRVYIFQLLVGWGKKTWWFIKKKRLTRSSRVGKKGGGARKFSLYFGEKGGNMNILDNIQPW